MMVAWKIVLGLREVTCIVERIHPSKNYKLVGLQGFVLALGQYLPMLVLFGLLEKQILVGGSGRVLSSPRLTFFLAPCKINTKEKKNELYKFKLETNKNKKRKENF